MSNLSFSSSVHLYVGRGTEVSISILSSSISSFIILYMKNQIYLETKLLISLIFKAVVKYYFYTKGKDVFWHGK